MKLLEFRAAWEDNSLEQAFTISPNESASIKAVVTSL